MITLIIKRSRQAQQYDILCSYSSTIRRVPLSIADWTIRLQGLKWLCPPHGQQHRREFRRDFQGHYRLVLEDDGRHEHESMLAVKSSPYRINRNSLHADEEVSLFGFETIITRSSVQ